MNNIFKIAICLTFTLMTVSAFAQPPQCDTCTYDYDHTWNPKYLDSVVHYKPFQVLSEYNGCPDGIINGERNVTFIHGLGGSIASWYKQSQFTRNTYETSSFGIDYTSSAYEVDLDEVAIEVNNDIGTRVANGVDKAYPNRCNLNDFAIAHSQGGIAARHLGRYWDLGVSTLGTRQFFGLVTFGTPHAGADIALTRTQHTSFVQQALSTVVLKDVANGAYDLTKRFGFLFGKSAADILDPIDTLIKNNLAPVFLGASVHTNTLDQMRYDNQAMININNHQSRVHKVAFYGVEEAPECWRVMNNMTDTAAEEYPLWGAQRDNALMDTMEAIRAEHVGAISENRTEIESLKDQANTPVWGLIRAILGISKDIATLEANTRHREKSVTFLNNANTEWRYLIGSYHRDSFTYVKETYLELKWEEKYGIGGKWYSQTRYFDTYQEALDHYSNVKSYKKRNRIITGLTRVVKKQTLFPSDGVVLQKSQVAYPGVGNRTDKMPRNNHFQERNSEETERVMRKLYKGGYDDFFFVPEK